jgi:hypothetical protein
MKLKTLLAIIVISTIGLIGGLSTFNNLNAIDGNLEPQANPTVIDDDGDLSASTLDEPYYIFTGTWTYEGRITIDGTVQIELAAGSLVTIDGGIQCAEGDDCVLTITGTGSLDATATGDGNAGIGANQDENAGTINIFGGTITAQGGRYGAGIGGAGNHPTGSDYGTINIFGGTILAQAGEDAAGIGGGYHSTAGEINISGGTIESLGNNRGPGIGGGRTGYSGDITISGGTISATSGGSSSPPSSAIGFGAGGNPGTTKITGGSINASAIATTAINPAPTNDNSDPVYLNALTVEDFEDSLVTTYYNPDYEYGINDVYTDEESKLYFYLPATEDTELVAVSFDTIDCTERYYGATYQRVADDEENVENLEYVEVPVLCIPDAPDAPADSANPANPNLASTGLNLDLAYLLLALLLLACCVIPVKTRN